MTYFEYPPPSLINELYQIACALVADGKGVFNICDLDNTLNSRLYGLNLEDISRQRIKYWQLFFTVDLEISNYISGMLLNEETLYGQSTQKIPFIELLKQRRIIPGVIVHTACPELFCSLQECTTEGLTNLGKRCAKFKKDGCHFTKWRSVFKISSHTPSHHVIMENSNTIGRYASICQANRLVPIIHADILQEGTYSTEECQKVAESVLAAIYKALHDYCVFLEGTLFVFNMVMQGCENPTKSSAEQIANATLMTLLHTIPCAIPGILLSCGDNNSMEFLDVMNRCNNDRKNPWKLTFAVGHGALDCILNAWSGKDENIVAAQALFLQLAKNNSDASKGKFKMEIVPGHVVKPNTIKQ